MTNGALAALQTELPADDSAVDDARPVRPAPAAASDADLSGVSAAVRRIFRELAHEVESARSGL